MKATHPRAIHFLTSGLFDELTSIAELEARIARLPGLLERGEAFEVFAEAYLATQPSLQARKIWTFTTIPIAIQHELALATPRDMGVDGVLQTTVGEYHAYQAKFRAGREALSWAELSTFMGLADQVAQRIVITNSNDLPDVMNDRNAFFCIRGSDLDRLEARDFQAIRSWLASGQPQRQPKSPRPHQREALDAIVRGLGQADRVTAIMACGTGKTLVALWTAEEMQHQTVLVLVPSLALIRQTLHEWLQETRWPSCAYLCVCSDPTVAKGADALVVHQSDLDFPVTTDSEGVRRFLAGNAPAVRLVFSTYQSATVVARGMTGLAPFDLGIFDEAHKTAGREGMRFAFALRDENLAIRKRLFLTATPRHYDIRHKDKEGDAAVLFSMDAPEIYGQQVYTLTFAEAARRGIICNYKVLVSVVTSDMVTDDLLSRGEVLVDGDAVRARQVAHQIALQKAVEKFGPKRIFTFHNSVNSAQSFCATGSEGAATHLRNFSTFHVNGYMRTAKRDQLLLAFGQLPRALMSNARCLTEGVDVPAVDMVAFISPRKSKVDIVQATGRAMRKAPEKTEGYVLVPVYVEQHRDEPLEAALARTDFQDVWDVLQAMKEQDSVLADIVRAMREERGRTKGFDDSRLRERVEALGPTVSLNHIRQAITTQCVERIGLNWDEMFGELTRFRKRFDHCNVPQGWPESPKLGQWVSMQRGAKRDAKL